MRRAASLALIVSLALAAACSDRQTRIRLTFPTVDGGTCMDQTNISCVNYLEFTAGDDVHGFSSDCARVPISLETLCDVGKLAEGQELFKLSPDTRLPIRLSGIRVYPAVSCNAGECPAKQIFAGQTDATGTVGDHVGQTLDIPVTLTVPCGVPEQFFFLPPGTTCAELCGGTDQVVCDHVQGGCLCLQPTMAPTQGGIDGGQ